jgi:hypothetical protein
MAVSDELQVSATFLPGQERPASSEQEAVVHMEDQYVLEKRKIFCPYRESNKDILDVQPVA